MAKRRATAQLTKENCEDADIEEESGEFEKAEKHELVNRVIRTARRRSSPVASPLTGFTGFTTPTSNSPFAFLNMPTGSNETPKRDVGQSSSKAAVPVPELVKELNLTCSKWIQQHLEKDPYVVLLPVFKDYEKHFSALTQESSVVDKPSTPTIKSDTPAPAFNMFANKLPQSGTGILNFSNDSKTDKAENSKPTFSFATEKPFGSFSKPNIDEKTTTGTNITKPSFSFGASLASDKLTTSTTNLPSFNFGGNSLEKTTNPPTFSFGGNSLEKTSTSGFTFDLNNKPKEEPSSNQETNNEDPTDEPPNFDFVAPGEEDSVFEMRCKVFLKKDGSFASIGVGTLFLKTLAGGKTQLITRADTSQGSVLLNLILTPDTPLQKTGKNNVLMVCVPTPELEPPPVPVLIRVKSEEERDKLLSEMERLRGSS